MVEIKEIVFNVIFAWVGGDFDNYDDEGSIEIAFKNRLVAEKNEIIETLSDKKEFFIDGAIANEFEEYISKVECQDVTQVEENSNLAAKYMLKFFNYIIENYQQNRSEYNKYLLEKAVICHVNLYRFLTLEEREKIKKFESKTDKIVQILKNFDQIKGFFS